MMFGEESLRTSPPAPLLGGEVWKSPTISGTQVKYFKLEYAVLKLFYS